MTRSLVLLLALAGFARGQGLPAERLSQLKAATAFIVVTEEGSRGRGTGSGFVIKNDGDDTYIVTNDHVINPEHARVVRGEEPSGKKVKVIVIFDSGTPGKERGLKAEIVAADPDRDLAVLKVSKLENAPKPIEIKDPPPLMETMPLIAFGYPFGARLAEGDKNPEITVNAQCSLSSIRKDDSGKVRLVQIAGSLSPGNSGGPIVNNDGKLIGVATSIIPGASIGQAVPQHEVMTMLAGRPGRVKVVMKDSAATEQGPATLKLGLIDPFKTITSATAYVSKTAPKASETGIAPGAMKLDLAIENGTATGDLDALPKGVLFVQIELENGDGKLLTSPIGVTVRSTDKPEMRTSPEPMEPPPSSNGKPRAYTREGYIVELPGIPLKEKPKASESATDLSDLNRKPESYLEKSLTLEGLSNCQIVSPDSGDYEITVLTEAGNPADNVRILLPKDIGLQLSEVFKPDLLDVMYALRLEGRVKAPVGRNKTHIYEVSELHFLSADGKPLTTLKSAGAPPGGEKPSLALVNRFPGDYRGKTVTLDCVINGVDNVSREPALKISHLSTMPVLNLKFYCSKDLTVQAASDVPGTGAMARIECVVEAVDARKGHGILGVTSIEILDADGKPKKKVSSTEKIVYPSNPPPKASAKDKPTPDATAKVEPASKRGEPEKKDDGNLVLYAGIVGGSVLVLLVGAFVLFKVLKKKSAPTKYASRTAAPPEKKAPKSIPSAPAKPPQAPVAKASKPAMKPKNDDNPFANLG